MNELSAQDRADLESIGIDPDAPEIADAPVPRTVLEVWHELLKNIEESQTQHIDPETASRIVRTWNYLKFQELPLYHALYHGNLKKLRGYVNDAFAENKDALKHTGVTEDGLSEDAVHNGDLYIELLTQWQLEIQSWSAYWDASEEDSHVELAAIADAQNFYLGEQGLANHLAAIGFEPTDEQVGRMAEALEAQKEGR